MEIPKPGRKLSVVYTWFFSILSVLAVILLINLGFNTLSFNYLEKETLNYYKGSTNLLQATVDMRLSEVENIVNQLGVNSNHIHLMNLSAPGNTHRKFAYPLTRELQTYKIANPLIKDVFISYPDLGCIVSSSGLFDAQPYYYLSDFKGKISLQEWTSLISDAGNRQFDMIRSSNDGLMLLKHTSPIGIGGKPKATLFVVINEAEIEKILASVKISVSPKLTALARIGEPVFSSFGEEDILSAINNFSLGGEIPGSFNDYLVTQTPSRFGHITYMVVNMKNEVLTSSAIFRAISLIGLLICLILGGFLSYFISKKNNYSILEAVKSISKGAKRNTDEYTYVTSYLKSMISEKSEIVDELEKQKRLVKQSLLIKVLKGEELEDDAKTMFRALFIHKLPLPFFAVIIIDIETVDRSQGATWQIESLTSIVEEAIPQAADLQFDVCAIHGNIVIVLNLPCELDADRDLPAEIRSVLDRLPEKFKEGSKAGIGSIYDYDRLTLSYHEAVEALEHAFDNDESQICRYSDIEKQRVGALRPYTSVLTKLDQLLRAKDYNRAEEHIKEIFAEYFNSSDQPEWVNSRKHAFIYFMADALEELQQRGKSIPEDIGIETLLAAKSLKKLKAESINIVNTLRAAESSETSDSEKLIISLKEFIIANYSDPDLSLYLMAEQIHMNHTQLSRLFKKHAGYGLSEYINKVRIEAAKKLLHNPQLTLKEIAGSVGYSSDINFIRVFKKYENVTPRNFGK
ncbi:helix-turn-helix domain-containing protein [Paenibacillus nasutitermitis]|uniref:helix-turn-helix domain-containing protein n=1 Tax=Paenibacillus nasutitermitis TaxID=1652958 RepID=UPI00166385B7|nr:helix-turn-helix domain-containing protein [Paenibacillus nasutitermitis]